MMHIKIPALFLFCVGLLVFAPPLQAKKKKHDQPQATPDPTPETAPAVQPGDLPSASLLPFLNSHLGGILALLGDREFDRPEILASLKAAYADGQAAAPAANKPAYQTAQLICDTLIADMTERRDAVSAWKGSHANGSSESIQPRGGQKFGQAEAESTNKFFAESQRNAWQQRAEVLRRNVFALILHERDLERRAAIATAAAVNPAAPAALPLAAAPAVVPTPSVSVPAPVAIKKTP